MTSYWVNGSKGGITISTNQIYLSLYFHGFDEFKALRQAFDEAFEQAAEELSSEWARSEFVKEWEAAKKLAEEE